LFGSSLSGSLFTLSRVGLDLLDAAPLTVDDLARRREAARLIKEAPRHR
jgi:hypothetical protein